MVLENALDSRISQQESKSNIYLQYKVVFVVKKLANTSIQIYMYFRIKHLY